MAAKKTGKNASKKTVEPTASVVFTVEIKDVDWKLRLEKDGFYIIDCCGDIGDWFTFEEFDDIYAEVSRLRKLF